MNRFARLLLLLGLVSWVVGGLASAVHDTSTRHVTCEHGETVELGGEGAAAAAATARAPDDGADHEHGCVLDGLTTSAVPIASATVSELPQLVGLALVLSRGIDASGDVLRDAPKTSPPERI